jgi:hypothetical protein
MDGCLIIHADVYSGWGFVLAEESEAFMDGMEFTM